VRHVDLFSGIGGFALAAKWVWGDDYRNVLFCDNNRFCQTRHGSGFMSNEHIPHNITQNLFEANVENTYQGKFRRALLDVSLLEYTMCRDDYINKARKNLVITCLDHVVNEYRFTYKDEIIYCSNEQEFVSKIAKILNIDFVYTSNSEDSTCVKLSK